MVSIPIVGDSRRSRWLRRASNRHVGQASRCCCSILIGMAACADLTITPMTPGDWPTVRRIYAEGIATGNATFEIDAPDWETWNRNHLTHCRVVARVRDVIVAWGHGGDAGIRPEPCNPITRDAFRHSRFRCDCNTRGRVDCGLDTNRRGLSPVSMAPACEQSARRSSFQMLL